MEVISCKKGNNSLGMANWSYKDFQLVIFCTNWTNATGSSSSTASSPSDVKSWNIKNEVAGNPKYLHTFFVINNWPCIIALLRCSRQTCLHALCIFQTNFISRLGQIKIKKRLAYEASNHRVSSALKKTKCIKNINLRNVWHLLDSSNIVWFTCMWSP